MFAYDCEHRVMLPAVKKRQPLIASIYETDCICLLHLSDLVSHIQVDIYIQLLYVQIAK